MRESLERLNADENVIVVAKETLSVPLVESATAITTDTPETDVPESRASNAEISVDKPVAETVVFTTQNAPKIDRTYTFNGRLGTISAVEHTKAEMTLAKASEQINPPFAIVEWTESRYYFHGKGAAGHHCAISHVYSAPTKTE